MAKSKLKYNNKPNIKERSVNSTPSDGSSLASKINFVSHSPKDTKIVEKDLGNGFKELKMVCNYQSK